ncbi:MAG TPA: hypothetical protein VFC31_12220 [Candidatus Limnocylindria bacterium]|nr:hypothetical protein [Candidatus Limnocylindria bacterium]
MWSETARRCERSARAAFFGEIALIDQGPRTATVTAETPMRVILLGPAQFRDVLYADPDMARQLLYAATKRLRETGTPPADGAAPPTLGRGISPVTPGAATPRGSISPDRGSPVVGMPDGGPLTRLSGVGLLSNESVAMSASSFADGLEFEETFPEPDAPEAQAPSAAAPAAPSAPPRLTVIRTEPAPAPAHESAREAVRTPAHADDPARDAAYEDQLERRLREAEAMVTQTVERIRLDEEKRLADWVRERREEEERRLAKWIEDRRASVERTLEQRSSRDDDLARRIEDMLVEWQARFEQRLEQRRADDDRMAERRRLTDEERLRTWRSELEQALAARFAERRPAERAPLPDRNGELRGSIRDALSLADSARDVGRVLRDVLSELARTSALALSVHHRDRDDVAYRYRVASEDELGTLLRWEALDDGPDSSAAHMDGWVRAHRAVRIGARDATVYTAQCAVRAGDATVGVITLQSEGEQISDAVLARVTDLVQLAAPRLAELRDAGRYRGV